MKGFKNQLIVAVAMVLVTAIALGTSTYAWFVNNATVKVDTFQLTASTARNLEIAINKTLVETEATLNALTTWGNRVSPFSNGTLKPASIAPSNMALASVKFFLSNALYSGTNRYETFTTKDSPTTDYTTFSTTGIIDEEIKAVGLAFRSSENMKVYLNASSAADLVLGTDLTKLTAAQWTSYIDPYVMTACGLTTTTFNETNGSSVKILLVPTATTAATRYTQGTGGATTDVDAAAAAAAKYATEANMIAKALRIGFVFGNGASTTDTKLILAPDTTTTLGSRADTTYFTSAWTDGEVITALDVNNKIDTKEDQTATALTNYLLRSDVTITDGYITSIGSGTGGTALFDLAANSPEAVTVYIWLEGCDYDCVTAIANKAFVLNLQFIGGPNA